MKVSGYLRCEQEVDRKGRVLRSALSKALLGGKCNLTQEQKGGAQPEDLALEKNS